MFAGVQMFRMHTLGERKSARSVIVYPPSFRLGAVQEYLINVQSAGASGMQPVFVILVMRVPFEHQFHLPVILAVKGPIPFVLVNVSPLHRVAAACETAVPTAASAVCAATALVMVMLAKTAASTTNQ